MCPEYITTGQAARLLNVSYSSVKSWCDRGLLDFYVVQHTHRIRTYVSRESVETFADRMKALTPNMDKPKAEKRPVGRPSAVDFSKYPSLQ